MPLRGSAPKNKIGWSRTLLRKSRLDLKIETGIQCPTLALMEQGRVTPTPEEAIALSKALGVPPDQLMAPIKVVLE